MKKIKIMVQRLADDQMFVIQFDEPIDFDAFLLLMQSLSDGTFSVNEVIQE